MHPVNFLKIRLAFGTQVEFYASISTPKVKHELTCIFVQRNSITSSCNNYDFWCSYFQHKHYRNVLMAPYLIVYGQDLLYYIRLKKSMNSLDFLKICIVKIVQIRKQIIETNSIWRQLIISVENRFHFLFFRLWNKYN